jgi:hypothetical protein
MTGEKDNMSIGRAGSTGYGDVDPYTEKENMNDFEVFKKGEDLVDFRTVSWPKASVIFLKGRLPCRDKAVFERAS